MATTKISPFTGTLDFIGSSTSDTGDIKYFGDPNTNGSWRIRIVSNNLVQERRESGVWVEKSAATP